MRSLRKQLEGKSKLLEARREADEILSSGSNRLLLIEAILIVCVFAAMFVSLWSAVSLLVSALLKNGGPVSLFLNELMVAGFSLVAFLAAPVVLGLFRLAEQMQAGNNPVLIDLFYFLSNRERYVQGLRATWLGTLKLVGTIYITFNIDKLFDALALKGVMWNWVSGILVVAVICLGTLLLLFPYARLYAALRTDRIDARADIFYAAPRGGVRLVWFYLPWLLLGFASIGVLLVLDVIPRMLLTYFCDCERQDLNIF